ncbi:hypothetical protein FIBSPDRAFT_283040 [Athelia psychrophila]|uniref:Uncharacterized protein n=1 Tax=Athelia psychrophila TaxID=1759441 RepID=A0A166R3P5_9AGAM|nr:hypothetical protein FIBSPDRAFT_365286 [Fibularhizoctonia sp. CBS 109695]KZP27867.1 hypothetical protein FIBSPDRAFT_283040 [Fibularhizoctonia sp. CBS 109695]
MDADKRDALFPFSDDHSLYDGWQRLLIVGRGTWPVLVAIPRGANGAVQLMTGIMHNLSVDSGKPVQEQTDEWALDGFTANRCTCQNRFVNLIPNICRMEWLEGVHEGPLCSTIMTNIINVPLLPSTMRPFSREIR